MIGDEEDEEKDTDEKDGNSYNLSLNFVPGYMIRHY